MVCCSIANKKEDPTKHDFWNHPQIGPYSQDVGSLCLCGLLGPMFGSRWQVTQGRISRHDHETLGLDLSRVLHEERQPKFGLESVYGLSKTAQAIESEEHALTEDCWKIGSALA